MIRNLTQSIKARKTIALLLTISASIIAAGIFNPPSFAVRALIGAAPAAMPAGEQKPPDKKPPLLIYSTLSGLEPAEITARPGDCVLMIRNRSGLDDLTFAVTTQPGSSPRSIAKAALGANVFIKLPLAVGETVITEASHPNWICRIKVVP